ncbi:prophage antirepressor-like protein [Pseudomonas nitritireducens]|uniref:Prophage antirepressor-like protein n=1 Tax=Pseudomonas nitroreducens TaxID=46680 RepID=A0A7W7KKM9_PSENT|nr:phage antirepressor [Pseudomonas nitritireducens]MBB4863793.1 prophage antirepressor-like protein [Pseudomonas nitritireducens]
MSTSMSFPSGDGLITQAFMRYNRPLRGVLLDQQPWFALRDLTKLTASKRGVELVRKLEPDQSRRERLVGATEDEWLVSESGVYALLMLHLYHPENRSLRQWLSNEVVPALRAAQQDCLLLPRHRFREVQGQQIALLDWQGRLWLRFADAARLMEREGRS